MSFFGGMQGLATGPGSNLRFASTRGRIQGSPAQGMNYPSPFFDVAHTYLPITIKSMFRWCRYYFLTNPILNAAVFKLSEYPVTDVIIEHESQEVVRKWTEYWHEHLRYRAFQVETGLDYHTYGNSFPAISYEMIKWLKCRYCGWSEQALRCKNNWLFTNNEFRLTCPKCGNSGDAEVHQQFLKNPSGIRLIRWNPEDIEIDYNPISGRFTYFYTIPPTLRNDITVGRKDIVADIPQVFIQAVKENKGIVFSPDKLFHLKRPSLATIDRGWGIPLLLPVLKDVFYMQIMKKAQEAVLLEHILPLRILFPQAASGTSDPFTTINLVEWREHVANEIARWRMDPNYIPIMPLPVGQQTLGGDGRALLLTGELQQLSEQLCVGAGVPREFLFGGLSYAGTNVSMRMLENAFIGYIMRQRQLAQWVMQEIATFLDWPMAKIRFKPFKMADDLQRKAFLAQINQMGKLSDTSLLAECDYDQKEENAIMIRETDDRLAATKKQQLAMAEMQGESQLIMAKYQAKAQQVQMEAQQQPAAPGEPGGPETQQAGASPGSQMAEAQPAVGSAVPPIGGGQQPQQTQQQPPVQQNDVMSQMGVTSPLNSGQNLQGQGAGAGIDIASMALYQAKLIANLPPDQQQLAIQNLAMQSPELAQMVQQFLSQMSNQQAGTQNQVDMRQQPDVFPPRRIGGQ